MNTNKKIASSQRVYRWLLHLYPQSYRDFYEAEMFHLFTDQYRDASRQGRLGILSLWFYTLKDFAVTVVHEHLSDPHARVGLLDAPPNEPLPWKGVLLLLLPGLIFFVSQIEQLTFSNDWFFVAFYRAGYFLILPVFLVSLLTRKFPVWGFIPLGLLYETLWNYGKSIQLSELPVVRDWFTNDTVALFNMTMSSYTFKYLLATLVCTVLLSALIWYNARQRQILRSAWTWLALCGLLILFQIGVEIYRLSSSIDQAQIDAMGPAVIRELFIQIPLWHFYDSLPLLVLIFIGMFFARKYKGFSFLLILGYLLPTIVFGRYGEWNNFVSFYVVSFAVVLYRFVVAFVAPVWLVRTAAVLQRQRAAAIPVVIAIASHIVLNIIATLTTSWQTGYSLGPVDFMLNIWDQVILAAGLALAVALYLPKETAKTTLSSPAPIATGE